MGVEELDGDHETDLRRDRREGAHGALRRIRTGGLLVLSVGAEGGSADLEDARYPSRSVCCRIHWEYACFSVGVLMSVERRRAWHARGGRDLRGAKASVLHGVSL